MRLLDPVQRNTAAQAWLRLKQQQASRASVLLRARADREARAHRLLVRADGIESGRGHAHRMWAFSARDGKVSAGSIVSIDPTDLARGAAALLWCKRVGDLRLGKGKLRRGDLHA
jgi:hypothetical protein